jgi:hypothetical protein
VGRGLKGYASSEPGNESDRPNTCRFQHPAAIRGFFSLIIH